RWNQGGSCTNNQTGPVRSGSPLVKGKYAALKWLDTPETDRESLPDLTDEIARLAKETDALQLPDYPAPKPSRLAQPLDRIQETKLRFLPDERLTITLGRDEYTADLTNTALPSDSLDDDGEDKELVSYQELFLIIRKPDFLGNAKWEFSHGKARLTARIEDPDWMEDFHARKHAIFPGDALRVRIRLEHQYDAKGNLTGAKQSIVKVFDVIPGPGPEDDLFEE
ncbi:hypothetical protein, partial [Tropicimonas aquimaris]